MNVDLHKTPPADERAITPHHDFTLWVAPVAVLLFAFVLVILALTSISSDNTDAYERGMYDGAHDLCQEVGGSWITDDSGWCSMPDVS